uniref:(northern house mosquito) hypothetical protein n=1 Tax=Culex pipiens TaxID=7175 RepID=A0A8D8HM93_CULPI
MIFFRPPACSPDKSRALTTCQHRRRSSSSCARTSPSLSCPCPLSTPGINLSQLTAESLPDQRPLGGIQMSASQLQLDHQSPHDHQQVDHERYLVIVGDEPNERCICHSME